MSGNEINRRDFLKVMGWGGAGAALAGCDVPSTMTLEEGKEDVVAYLVPEEFVIPGIGVYYASVCQQCPAGCGIHGRVREGRVLKVEGNPNSPLNKGKVCQMGQAGLQGHYNPDRLTRPLLRKGKKLVEASWDEALAAINERVGPDSGLDGDRFAWVTGTVSGHQAVLIDAYMAALGASRHYVHEMVNNAVGQAVNRDMLGVAMPRYRLDKAQAVLSLGADFLGAWISPVHFANQYAAFREAPRGVLAVAEPSMSLTGANADLWMAVRPGTEGALALGIARELVTRHRRDMSMLPAQVQAVIRRYSAGEAAEATGVRAELIAKTAAWLAEREPSLVLSGTSAESVEHGYQSAAAAMLLNIILGNVGETIELGGEFPFPQMAAKYGNSADLLAFSEALRKRELDVVFFYGSNPVYTSPDRVSVADRLINVPFKVAFSQYMDETTKRADVVLPLLSPYEDWGTHVVAYQGGDDTVIGVQQPVMEPLYPTTRGFGDVMLDLLKVQEAEKFGPYSDYYAYLREAFDNMPANLKQGLGSEAFWQRALAAGMITLPRTEGQAQVKAIAPDLPEYRSDEEYPYHLVPAARLGMWDGRHANLPWLQEAPDQISKVVWNSWAELHPRTAEKLGVKTGDYIKIESENGTIETQVYVYKGVRPEVVAVPMGRGHEDYGRYATGRGVNPLKILNAVTERQTGELALYGTRVKLTKTGRSAKLIKMGGSESQMGRKLVASVTAEVFRRTEGGA
ncbi:MAG TPA: molybdopterin dinucleotide-binding protein [Gammaproteobacteria bacterium]|nr:molybdopterin dinucleotide-binding protein [Gammaproteobacteria bacterium]